MIPLNDLRRQPSVLDGSIDAVIKRVTHSGWYSLGPEVRAFEHELAAFVGTRHAVGVASGTDALELALTAVGCRPGDEVITVANAGAYTSMAALAIGCRPRLIDIDPRTLLMDAGGLEEAIVSRTRAVVLTHLYGHLGPVDDVSEICAASGIALVEDCAQAIGATRDGRQAGTFGDAAAFSFYPTKNLGALGDGGAVLTARDDIADSVRALRQYGWGERYRIVRPGGTNSRLDEMQAAVLSAKLPRLADANARRRAIVARYRSAAAGTDLRFVGADGLDDVAHLAVMLTPDRQSTASCLAEAEVATGIHYPFADDEHPGLLEAIAPQQLPFTRRALTEILTVPCFAELEDREIDQVCHAITEAARRL